MANKRKSHHISKRALAAAWESGDTKCRTCSRQMYFPRFETADEFLGRIVRRGRLARTIFLQARTASTDHITKIADGGEDTFENTHVICQHCNNKHKGMVNPFGIREYADHE